jgi:hypothetical protein
MSGNIISAWSLQICAFRGGPEASVPNENVVSSRTYVIRVADQQLLTLGLASALRVFT